MHKEGGQIPTGVLFGKVCSHSLVLDLLKQPYKCIRCQMQAVDLEGGGIPTFLLKI